MVAMLASSDLILLVAMPDVPCISATRYALGLLERLEIQPERIGVILNRNARRCEIHTAGRDVLRDCEVLGELPADFDTLQPFTNTGAFLGEANRTSLLLRTLRDLSERVVQRWQ